MQYQRHTLLKRKKFRFLVALYDNNSDLIIIVTVEVLDSAYSLMFETKLLCLH